MKRWAAYGLCLAAIISQAEAGKIFRWTDAEGNIHYGDRPVAANSEPVRVAPPPSNAGSTDRFDSQQNALKAIQEERAKQKDERAEAKAQKEKKEQACVTAKAKLATYTTSRYLYDMDAQGNRRILSDEERAASEENARQHVKEVCD